MAVRYRCLNGKCADKTGIPGHEFVSDQPVCDRCGTDQRHPRFGSYIHTLKVLHFDPPSHIDGLGQGHLACDPKRAVASNRATADPGSVNCPACKETQAYKDALKGPQQILDEDDFQVSINPARGAPVKKDTAGEELPAKAEGPLQRVTQTVRKAT